jgi:hypothetical protein
MPGKKQELDWLVDLLDQALLAYFSAKSPTTGTLNVCPRKA